MFREITPLRGLILFASTIFFLAGCEDSRVRMNQNDKGDTNLKVGGPCTYNSYQGHARITRITKTEASVAQKGIIGGPGYEGYEVWFRFIPEESVPSELESGDFLEREHLFSLQNGWYVGPRYIKKYGLEPGKEYPSVLKVIKTGSCTPRIFDLEGIEKTDYFETVK